jgi:hypothetical protein
MEDAMMTTSSLDPTTAKEAWKHFAKTGGDDKNQMVKVCNWLLSFSVGIIGFAFAQGLQDTPVVSKEIGMLILSIFGAALSFTSALVATIYGGYTNYNWAKADQIAEDCKWDILSPENDPWGDKHRKAQQNWVASKARAWAAPRNTYSQLAPIFLVYIFLSGAMTIVHIVIFLTMVFRRAA